MLKAFKPYACLVVLRTSIPEVGLTGDLFEITEPMAPKWVLATRLRDQKALWINVDDFKEVPA